MKKILNLLASVSLIAAGASNAVACGSHQTPSSEVQKLYDELNETTKPFLIENNNFWGNEHNYRQDLLQNLEQSAQIPKKDDGLLSVDQQNKPLENYGKANIVVDIGSGSSEKYALVSIDWELTAAQKPIYQFYAHVWPKKISDLNVTYGWSNKNFLTLASGSYVNWDDQTKSPTWKPGMPLGWWDKTYGNQLLWDASFSSGLVYYLKLLRDKMPQLTYLTIGSDVPQPKTYFNINQLTNLPNDAFYVESGGIKFPLLYYPPFNVSDPLPKPENWQFMYQTDENLMEQLNTSKDTWYISSLDMHGTSASNPDNENLILNELSQSKWEPFTDTMSFAGNIRTDGKPGKIKVLYGKNHVDINTNILVGTY